MNNKAPTVIDNSVRMDYELVILNILNNHYTFDTRDTLKQLR